MAASRYAAAITSSLCHHQRRFTVNPPYPRKSILIVSRFHTSYPTKTTKRKNYLREKLLKTLQKSVIPKLPPSNLIIPIDLPPIQEKEDGTIQEVEQFDWSKSLEARDGQVQFLEDSTGAESSFPAGVSFDRNVGILAESAILKFGLWLVGAFVFQVICAVWIFGSTDVDNKKEILNGDKKKSVLERRGTGVFSGNGKIGVENGGVGAVVYVDDLEMERKIKEIRAMAREAREKERLQSKKSGLDSEENDEIDGGTYVKSGIEEEVDNRLIKLRKKFEDTRDRMPVPSVGHSKKGDLDVRQGSEELLFRKKYKFKGFSGDQREKPRGFAPSFDNSIDKSNESGNSEQLLQKEKVLQNPQVKDGQNSLKSVTADVKSVELDVEAVALRGSSAPDASGVINELSKGNGGLNGKGVGDAKLAKKGQRETGIWWLNLPYVLGILTQWGNDAEGRERLYTLKSADGIVSYVVAFEDRVDATNFCYLLHTFENSEDFYADIVPFTVKELSKAMNSQTMKVIVVKKGQLRLYAGQPPADVEMALRAIVERG